MNTEIKGNHDNHQLIINKLKLIKKVKERNEKNNDDKVLSELDISIL